MRDRTIWRGEGETSSCVLPPIIGSVDHQWNIYFYLIRAACVVRVGTWHVWWSKLLAGRLFVFPIYPIFKWALSFSRPKQVCSRAEEIEGPARRSQPYYLSPSAREEACLLRSDWAVSTSTYSRDPMWHIPAGGGGAVCVANTRVSSFQAVLSSAFSGKVLLNGQGLHSKVKDTVLFGPKLNVQYSMFVRQTDESVWLRKVETWLLYCVLLTVFSQSYLRSKFLVQYFIPFKFRPVFHLFYQN